jgi:hypothetical protein
MKAIVFIPGYKGSFLKSGITGERKWLTIKQLIDKRETMKLTITAQGAVDKLSLVPDKIFDSLDIFPGIELKNIHLTLENKLLKTYKNKFDVHFFTYDWRLDIFDTIKKLKEFLTNLYEFSHYQEINVIGHSFGGYLLSYFLRYLDQDPENSVETWGGTKFINKVVFMGVPFRGALKGLAYMHVDKNRIGLNDKLIDKYTTMSFPIAYQVLPYLDRDSLLLLNDNTQIPLDNLNNWMKYKIGLFNDASMTEDKKKTYYDFIRLYHTTGNLIMNKINAECKYICPNKISILNIVSKKHLTPKCAYIELTSEKTTMHHYKNVNAKSNSEMYSKLTGIGDGLVLERSALLPAAYKLQKHETHETLKNHDDMIRDEKVLNEIIAFIDR